MASTDTKGAPCETPLKDAAKATANVTVPTRAVGARWADHARRFRFNPFSDELAVSTRWTRPASPRDVSECWFTSYDGRTTLRFLGVEVTA